MELSFDRTKNQYVVINQDILDGNDFIYPTYRQLIKALDEVVRRADRERSTYDVYAPPSSIARSLYLYGNNVIAISGRRGQGKTSAMLSFSSAMGKAGRDDGMTVGPFADHSFVVLDPIDPTVLETKQSPLMLILSRMYRKVEEVWERSLSVGGRATDQSSADADRRMLVDQFQKCFSGIREVKSEGGEAVKSLAALHNLSDSSQLKVNFYELVCKLLDFCGSKRHGKRSFLVIQLDDTDFQVDKGYEVLDDIRKYLTLPNVIILMATDMSLMHKVVAQHFAQELGTAIGHNLVSVTEVENNASKYLDKLLPPSQVVHLPSLGVEMGRVDTALEVILTEGSERILPAEHEENLTLENTVLRFLYRKTGILCVSKADKAHGFVPTTLRGLMQLLNLLASLEDVPQIPPSAMGNGRRHAFARALNEQLAVKEYNLRVFEDYFLHTWANAKFSAEEWLASASGVRRLLTKLADETGLDDLCCDLVRELNTPKPDWDTALKAIGAVCDDMQSIDVSGQMGRCFVAAVNIAVALRWNKAAIREMKSELSNLEGKGPLPYTFKLWHEVTKLPKNFANRKDASWGENSLGSQIHEALQRAKERNPDNVYDEITETMAPGEQFRMLHLVQVMLAMGKVHNGGTLVNLSRLGQKEVYESQMAALIIACSPELQTELIRVEESRLGEEQRDTVSPEDSASRIISTLDGYEEAINKSQIGVVGNVPRVPELVQWSLRIGRFSQWVLPNPNTVKEDVLSIWFSNLFTEQAQVHAKGYSESQTDGKSDNPTEEGTLQGEAQGNDA